jgi:hypothetical protein
MDKNANIYVKLQIEKSQKSGNLLLNIHFDKDAPNFSEDKHSISWTPTLDEISFIEETFQMISNYKGHINPYSNEIRHETNPPLEKEEKSSPPVDSTDEPQEFIPESNQEQPTEIEEQEPEENQEEQDKKIFVQANEETIDELIKKRSEDFDDGLIVEADEKTIIDRVLKQKKKKH